MGQRADGDTGAKTNRARDRGGERPSTKRFTSIDTTTTRGVRIRDRAARPAERSGEFRNGLKSIGRDFLERARHRVIYERGDCWPLRGNRVRNRGDDLRDDRLRRGADEWRRTDEHLIQHAA